MLPLPSSPTNHLYLPLSPTASNLQPPAPHVISLAGGDREVANDMSVRARPWLLGDRARPAGQWRAYRWPILLERRHDLRLMRLLRWGLRACRKLQVERAELA